MHLENLFKSLNDFKNKFEFKIHFTKDQKDLKNKISNINYTSLDYSIDFLNYQKSYHEMNVKNIFDISFFIINKGKTIAYCPLYLIQKEKFELTSNFKYIVEPLISKKLDQLNIKNIINYFIDLIFLIKKTLKIKYLSFVSDNKYGTYLSDWDKELLKLNCSSSLIYEQSINLENDKDYIWLNIRKSYKNLINRYQKKIKVFLYDGNNQNIWRKFQAFHIETSKKITRNQTTWDNQLISIKNKSAFFFYILDEKNNLIGGSLFDSADTEAYYSVGVYNRKLNKLPLSHLILNKSIEFFKKEKIKNITLGEYKFDKENLDDKILSIQNFKSGFANKINSKVVYRK